jgi:hypothetical protein
MANHRSLGLGTGGDFMPLEGEVVSQEAVAPITATFTYETVLTGRIIEIVSLRGSIDECSP